MALAVTTRSPCSQGRNSATWRVETVYGSSGEDTINADVPSGPIYVDGRGGNDYIDVGYNTPTDATVYGGTGNDTMSCSGDQLRAGLW